MTGNRTYNLLLTLTLPLALGGFPLVLGIASLLNIESQTLSVPYRGSILALSLLCLFLSLSQRRDDWYWGPARIPLFVFLILYTFRLLIDTLFPTPNSAFEPWLIWLFFFGIGIIPMWPFLVKASPVIRWAAVKWLYGYLLAGAVVNLGVSVASYQALDSEVFAGGRAATETLNAISLGQLGASLSLISLYLILRKKGGWLQKSAGNLVLGASIFLGAAILMASGSRGPLVAFVIALGLYVLVNFRKLGGSIFFGIGLVVLALLSALSAIVSSTDLVALQRFEVLLDDPLSDMSFSGRVELARDAFDQFLANPFLGSALVELESGYYPHNIVLESFMATGLFGGLAFVAFCVVCLRIALRNLKSDEAWIGLFFIQYFVGNLFSGSLFIGWNFWITMACVLGWDEYVRSNPDRAIGR